MNSYENRFIFDELREKAETVLNEEIKEIDDILTRMNSRVGNKKRSAMVGGIVFTAVWLAAYIALFVFIKANKYNTLDILMPIMLVSCISLGALVLAGEYIEFKYFNSIIVYRDRIQAILGKLSQSASLLHDKESSFRNARSKGFNYAIINNNTESLAQNARYYEKSVTSLEKINAGPINTAKNILFYVVMVSVTAVTLLAMQDYACGIVDSVCDFWPSDGLYYAVSVVVLIAQIILGRFLWACTSCSVTNLTLFATIAGPVMMIALTLVLMLISVIVIFVIAIAAVALSLVCVCGILTGG